MGYEALRLDVEDGVARLTFIDVERGNPIDGRFCDEFRDVAIELSELDGLRAIVLRAEGPVFSYGGDIAMFVEQLDELPAMIKRWTAALHSGIARMQRLDAPIVAAVHGVCAGGMSGMVAGSDIVVASEKARFVAAYAGIGYNCDASSSITYSRRMGLGRARRFLIMNETLTAEEAEKVGLVDYLTTPEGLAAKTEEIVSQLAAGPTKAFGEMRRLLLSAGDQPLETQLELEAQALARTAGTADAREGLTAFHAKRQPVFKGV